MNMAESKLASVKFQFWSFLEHPTVKEAEAVKWLGENILLGNIC